MTAVETLQSLGLIPAGHTESPRIKDEPCSDEEIDTFLVGEMNAATVRKESKKFWGFSLNSLEKEVLILIPPSLGRKNARGK